VALQLHIAYTYHSTDLLIERGVAHLVVHGTKIGYIESAEQSRTAEQN